MTPRPYLSYTQLITLEKGGDEHYADVYLRGKKIPVNRGMAKGRELAESLELDEATGDALLDLVASKLPRLDLKETEVRCELNFNGYKVPLLAKPDTHQKDLTMLFEYKSGTTPWTQRKVDADDQLTFYSVVLISARRDLMTKAGTADKNFMECPRLALFWAPTEYDEHGRIRFIGDVHRFDTTRDWTARAKMQLRMKEAWKRIELICERELV